MKTSNAPLKSSERPAFCPLCGHWDIANRFAYGPNLFTCMGCGIVFPYAPATENDKKKFQEEKTMIDDKVITSLIDFLNGVLMADQKFMETMVERRLPCNENLARHPTVQIAYENECPVCGLLGLLNGFCGVYAAGPLMGQGPIMAVFDNKDDSKLLRFEKTAALALRNK